MFRMLFLATTIIYKWVPATEPATQVCLKEVGQAEVCVAPQSPNSHTFSNLKDGVSYDARVKTATTVSETVTVDVPKKKPLNLSLVVVEMP